MPASAAEAPLSSIASSPVHVANPGDTVRGIAKQLDEHQCGALVVHRRDGGLAVVSERDIVRALAGGGDPDAAWAVDVMTSAVLTLPPDDTIAHAGALMQEHGVRHVVVVDGDAAVGVVSNRDILRALLP